MYLRFLQAFMMIRTFGATLIMIKEMLKDLLAFIWLAIFVVFGVGIYYHANLWPDHLYIFGDGSIESWRIWRIISLPYWQLYGESNEEYISGKDQSDCTNITSIWTTDLSRERCPREDWTVVLIAAFYMLFSNLLLVNLVIAMFSYTFGRVKSNSEKLWMYERYVVINDFKNRKPSLINLICFVRYIINRLFQKCMNRVTNNPVNRETTESKKKEEKQNLMKFQKIMATRVVYAQSKTVMRTAERNNI
ncbi:transient receptor potential cation channel subfamily M member-like 2 [Saccostrea echinata]|uniref:transient receptor potential cation channel subfamily M member-like 2 n=1 Tax=Saccostrea echinata TaxID=191078 RepID=UPI002A82137F|nr:transient receptor potential cation channel subfamily M member-like 2 [Saccostrea echinata]